MWWIFGGKKTKPEPKKGVVRSCMTCRFNCEDDHTVMNDCNVGTYYAEKGIKALCYSGELYEPKTEDDAEENN